MTDGHLRKRTHGTDARAYNEVLDQVLRIAQQMTVEIDQTPHDFVDHVIEGLELSECVRLMQGQIVRKNKRNYYAYMADSDRPRPGLPFLEDLYDRACDAELLMRSRGTLDCPYCTIHESDETASQ